MFNLLLKLICLTTRLPLLSDPKLQDSLDRLLEENGVKARLDKEEELRQEIHKEAESKLRKDTESVLQRVQNLEQDFKSVHDKMDNILEMLKNAY